ncbi:MAG: aldehyde dehydrogenase family protein [Candidatus Krumholzibacteria bacterium]|jgi:aldehyde dehydrogenase (NAD+)|nr:aldehyde dehydrogenase family protein [Candidatus Krumholzibacteria bacterium]MDP6669833.1 aldehyde dehydrogenase family protein [Candidatus Krumholzibacteria bacterium]MDP6798135.1 aldehyde dehydrogenase family protein [Candidatus Krumholzibacteria bacterium]MDP7022232.1 aldehyde dehydrogenase family protein [Candidatus Krumholzibacteria bacterium]
MHEFLKTLKIEDKNSGASSRNWIENPGGEELDVFCPGDGSKIASVTQASVEDYEKIVSESVEAFKEWRRVPAPERGQIVRIFASAFRDYKEPLGQLVSYEMGKILSEGEGEVQEMIDIADFAVGLSRTIGGPTLPSERPGHRLMEQWHPLGPVGVVTAFNFPVAVWAWNAMIAAVCGDSTIWKPSSKTPLTAIAVQHICNEVMKSKDLPPIFSLVVGRGSSVGEMLINDRRVPLISATGSTRMGCHVGKTVGGRLGRTLLELGGNNAIIVDETANLDLALRATVFGAVGTAGQRCTSTRRLFLHESLAEDFTAKLVKVYESISIGDPLDRSTLMGPLIDEDAVSTMLDALEAVKAQGGEILTGGQRLDRSGHFVQPTIVRGPADMEIVREETFAPVLYVFPYSDLDQAIEAHNSVDQGLSSAMFSTNFMNAEKFLGPEGSDCGIANINAGTSGAEIGGAFGGEKDTGGGRESGSDAWKIYMRRQTNTLNYSTDMPLAQGVEFDI